MEINKSIKVLFAWWTIFVLSACGGGSGGGGAANVDVPPSIPDIGAYLGGILNQEQMTIDEFNAATGIKHKVFMEFFLFPEVLDMTSSEYSKVSNFIAACKASGAIPMLTLETYGGLESYTTDQILEFASMLYSFNTSMFLRWNHEMNGSWYPWGQQPTLYKSKFQQFANIVHSEAPNVAIAWTPNQGWGYPWAGGTYSIQPTNSDYDYVMANIDDPYGPYFPGADCVDWVGFSFYHWGNGTNRGVNEIPTTGKWSAANGIDGSVLNFHDIYAVGYDKPMMIAETAALYKVDGGGASESDIKNEWITQVYNLTSDENGKINVLFPRIHLIQWFNQLKYETEITGEVDWQITSNETVINNYRTTVDNSYFIKAD